MTPKEIYGNMRKQLDQVLLPLADDVVVISVTAKYIGAAVHVEIVTEKNG